MVVGLLVVAAIPTTVGVCQALSAQKKADNAEKEKAKFNLTATVSLDGDEFTECWCVLGAGRLWIDHPEAPLEAHKFTGYYFTYPSEEQHLGLVSTIADDPPMLNWIFVDKDSHLVRHGSRQDTLGGHTVGPWGWSEDEQWLTLEGDDGSFVALEQENERWALYYDGDGRIRRGEMEGGGEDKQPPRWVAARLHRKLMFGMESRYVKGDKNQGGGGR